MGIRNCAELWLHFLQTVYGWDGELLNSTEDIVSWWKEYFEEPEPLNPTHTYSEEEADLQDLENYNITGAMVAVAVKQLCSCSAPRVDEFCPDSSRL